MELVGDFIKINGHKKDKVFNNKEVLINKDAVSLIAETDEGVLVLTLSDGSTIQCDGTFVDFSEKLDNSRI